jgi:hypothetical protein
MVCCTHCSFKAWSSVKKNILTAVDAGTYGYIADNNVPISQSCSVLLLWDVDRGACGEAEIGSGSRKALPIAANKAVGADELGQDVVQVAKRATDTISGEEVRADVTVITIASCAGSGCPSDLFTANGRVPRMTWRAMACARVAERGGELLCGCRAVGWGLS